MGSMRRALIGVTRIINMNISPNRHIPANRSSATSLVVPYCDSRPQIGWFSGFSSNNCVANQSRDIDFSNEENKRRLVNRLLYRSKQRGFLELDLVFGKWVEEHICSMDESGVKSLVNVLDLENPDLWKWLSGQEQPPEKVTTNPVFTAIRDKVMKTLNTHAVSETRAMPGQPWVRGWDDIKKGLDRPISGNQ